MLVPLCFLGRGLTFSVLRMFICLPLTFLFLTGRRPSRSTRHPVSFFLLLALLMGINILVKGVASLLFFMEFMYIFFNGGRNAEQKDFYSDRFVLGCGIAGVLGFLNMGWSNVFVVGGDYTENTLNISNITVPIFMALYIIHLVFRQVSRKKVSIIGVAVISALVLAMIYLGKRGPILFLVVSVACACFIKSGRARTLLLVVTFLYPFYEIPLVTFLSEKNEVLSKFTERVDDFRNVEDNPRVVRLLAATQFLEDFEYTDLFGYHKELQLSSWKGDKAHNHFHNFLLQLYYETGLLSVVSVLSITFLLYGWTKRKDTSPAGTSAFACILFLYLIGTNESLMKGSMEIVTLFFLTYIYSREFNKQ